MLSIAIEIDLIIFCYVCFVCETNMYFPNKLSLYLRLELNLFSKQTNINQFFLKLSSSCSFTALTMQGNKYIYIYIYIKVIMTKTK